MTRFRTMIFARQKIKPNTFIGGVSGTINTPALAASAIGVTASRIKAFNIIGSNIQFAVTGGTYSVVQTGLLKGNTSLTYYDDRDGLVTTLLTQCFRGCTNLASVNFPKVTQIQSYVFENSKLTGIIDFPLCTTIQNNAFSAITGLSTFNFPVLSSLSSNNFIAATQDITVNVPLALKTSNAGKPDPNLTWSGLGRALINYIGYTDDTTYNTEIGGTTGNLYIPDKRTLAVKLALGSGGIDNYQNIAGVVRFKATDRYGFALNAFLNVSTITYYDDSISGMASGIGSGAFQGSSIQWAKFYGITSIGGDSSFRNNANLNLVDLPNIQSFSGKYFGRNCANLRSLSWPNLTNITGSSSFYGDANSIRDFYFPKLIQCGDTTGNDSVFHGKYPGGTITVNIALQTNNAGAPDGDLVYTSGTMGTTIIYV